MRLSMEVKRSRVGQNSENCYYLKDGQIKRNPKKKQQKLVMVAKERIFQGEFKCY
jgi:hypothetical protein